MSECGIELDTGIVPEYRGMTFEEAMKAFIEDLEVDGFTPTGKGTVTHAIRNGETLYVGDRVALGGYIKLIGSDETEPTPKQ